MNSTFPDSPPPHICDDVLAAARRAAQEGEIPVAAALYRLDREVGQVWEFLALASNRTATERDPLAHAELQAIQAARRRLQREYLSDCALITTLEPCLLCAGALLLSRIGAIYYFAPSTKGIRLGDIMHLSSENRAAGRRDGVSNHHPPIFAVPAFEEPARAILEEFFRSRRAASRNQGSRPETAEMQEAD